MFGPAKLKPLMVSRRVEIQLCDGRSFKGFLRLPSTAGINDLFVGSSQFLMVKTSNGEIAINRATISAILLGDNDPGRPNAESPMRKREPRDPFQARGPRGATEPPKRPLRNSGLADPCRVLGVSQNATMAQVKSAWRQRMKECHPDALAARGGGADAIKRAQVEAANVNAAYRAILALHEDAAAA
ncbi:MAG: DnaJ domain-containing protein [Pseudomonadota bacterium]